MNVFGLGGYCFMSAEYREGCMVREFEERWGFVWNFNRVFKCGGR